LASGLAFGFAVFLVILRPLDVCCQVHAHNSLILP
jgi:hypothetical protein